MTGKEHPIDDDSSWVTTRQHARARSRVDRRGHKKSVNRRPSSAKLSRWGVSFNFEP